MTEFNRLNRKTTNARWRAWLGLTMEERTMGYGCSAYDFSIMYHFYPCVVSLGTATNPLRLSIYPKGQLPYTQMDNFNE